MKVAICQWHPSLGDSESNISRMEDFSKDCDSDIIVFPELFFSGYSYDTKEEILPNCATRDRFEKLAEISRQDEKLIIGGFPEVENGSLYNSIFAISSGEVNIYRKMHLWAKETVIFQRGNQPVIVDFKGTRVGMEICYDLQFPELARILSLQNVDIMACPMAWAVDPNFDDKTTPIYNHLAMAQSYSNGVFTIVANMVGVEKSEQFDGYSGIADPFGNFKGLGSEEGEFYAEIDLTKLKIARRPSPNNDIQTDRWLHVSVE